MKRQATLTIFEQQLHFAVAIVKRVGELDLLAGSLGASLAGRDPFLAIVNAPLQLIGDIDVAQVPTS